MKLNVDKCKAMSIVKHSKVNYSLDYGIVDKSGVFHKFELVENMSDLGVTVDADLSFSNHIHEKINKSDAGLDQEKFQGLNEGCLSAPVQELGA